jgi:hypothetical protein
VRVLATGSDPVTVRSRILVLDDLTRPPVPVVLVARLAGPPALDPDGVFATDPSLYPRPRSDAERLLDAAGRHPSSVIVLSAPPVLVEEWLRASDGYKVIEPGGTREVPPEDPIAIASASLVRRLRDSVQARRVEVLDVPYAEPDVRALDAAGAANDLRDHWALSTSVFARATGSSPASGTAFFVTPVPRSALEQAQTHGARFVVLAPGALASGNATASPGAYRIGQGLVGLVPSPALAEAARADDPDAFYDVLFDRATSKEPTSPVIALFELGPGARHTAADVERALGWIDAAPWAVAVSASDAARADARRDAVPNADAPEDPPAPAYWPEVARARSAAVALSEALGPEDDDARRATHHALVAESALWAGADGTYALRERALSFARSAYETAQRFFDGIAIDAKDVTLPGVTGDVPISIVNTTGKPMRLSFDASAARASVRGVPKPVTVQPGENVVTVAVDMKGEISDRVRISLASGDLTLASSEILVRASYLDRIVTIAGVLLFLLVLLAYIRRRAMRAEAGGTIAPGDVSDGYPPTNGS